ncbi:MAG: peptidylprolyl isomerase [Candidatus Latescibacteria bacterium]|nr:peptidylprolyl isomerase [Candidatus Latescibacterota bacterium]
MRGIAKGVLLAALIGLAGCARHKEGVVADVGERAITEQELKGLAGKMPSLTKERLLWVLIDKEIMIQEAYDRGLDKDEGIRARMEGMKRIEMARLLKEELRRRMRIPEEEARRFYKERGLASLQEVKARHIMVRTKEEAEEILRALKDGADFAQLAKERSLDKVSAEQGGELGYWREGVVIGPTARKVFSMEVGECSEPFEDFQGKYHIIEVLDKHPIGFDGLKPTIVNRLKGEQINKVFREYIEAMKERLHLSTETKVVSWFVERCEELGGRLDGFSDEEKRKVIVRHGDQEALLGDYLGWLELMIKPSASRLSDSTWVARSVERFVVDCMVVPYAAHEEGIDQSEWLRSHLKKNLEGKMVTELKKQEVDRKVLTPEAVRAYYVSHKDRYYNPPRAVIRTVLLDSLKWAQEAYEKVRKGTEMADVAGDYPSFHNKYGSYGRFSLDLIEKTNHAEWAPYLDRVIKAKIGKVNRPVKLSFIKKGEFLSGYAIFDVVRREPEGFVPLETGWVRRDIERKLRVAERARIDALYEKWQAALRAKYEDKITIYPERLKSLELPESKRKPVF